MARDAWILLSPGVDTTTQELEEQADIGHPPLPSKPGSPRFPVPVRLEENVFIIIFFNDHGRILSGFAG